jgi:RNA polymerase sigma-70 factor (ECF subfamily)
MLPKLKQRDRDVENTAIDIQAHSDLELVAMARQGDTAAFGTLTQRHWRKCVDVGCFVLRNRGEAEDQAQNAIMKAYEHLDQYHGDAEFSTWLGRIVANECLMLIRSRRRARFLYLDGAPSDPTLTPVQLPASGPDPEGELAYFQLSEVLQTEVRRIPPLMRNVMVLRDLQGLPMRNVAEQLGISIAAAKSRLVRARAELRERMQRHYGAVRNSSPFSRTAVPLSRVGRRCILQAIN